VLFLDEPTTGIDPRSRADIWELIQDLVTAGTTILLTSQYLDEADQLAARIGVIDRGKLIKEGTPEQLKDELGGAFVELTVDGECRDETMRVLADVNGQEPIFEPSSKKISLGAPDGATTLIQTVRRLDEASITPTDISLRKPTLDDVFLAYTGHVAEEETTTDEDAPAEGRRQRRSA